MAAHHYSNRAIYVCETTRGSTLHTVHAHSLLFIQITYCCFTSLFFFSPRRASGKFDWFTGSERQAGIKATKSCNGLTQGGISAQLFSGVRSAPSYSVTTAEREKQQYPKLSIIKEIQEGLWPHRAFHSQIQENIHQLLECLLVYLQYFF